MPDLYWLPTDPEWTTRSNESLTGPAAWRALVALANKNLDFIQTGRLDKHLQRTLGETPPEALTTQPVRLAILSSCTTDQLLPSLRVGALRRDLWLNSYTTAYGQYFNEVLDPSSSLHAFQPNAILCAFDTQHLLGQANIDAPSADAQAQVAAAIARLRALWKHLHDAFQANIIQQTLLPTAPTLLGNNEHRLPGSINALVARVNEAMRDAADQDGVDILALDSHAQQHGSAAWHDPRLWLRAKQYVSPTAAPLYGDLVGRILAARQGRSFKCLVLDLDNTLWGGVIGDDGLEKIILGQGNGLGEAYLAFQRYAQDLSKRGIILAICSKNDEANALAPFDSHPEMVLRRGDIACFIANWHDKASNLRTIAQQLNIGLDALVFADDNPFERNLVRRELPMVAVPELPEDPTFYASCIADAGYFESVELTTEDLERSQQYQTNAQRLALRTSHTDLDAYLHSLDMALEWGQFDNTNIQRIVQLINKTNQFNLTTRRYSEEQIRALMLDPQAILLYFRLKDSFGDNGIIAIVIALNNTGTKDWRIDTWLMSCRVLGRQVERASLNVLVDQAYRLGAVRLIGEYLPSPKNSMVRTHYATLGFSCLNDSSQGTSWVLDTNDFTPTSPPMTTTRI